VFAQLARAEINFKAIEAKCRTRLWIRRQGSPGSAGSIRRFLVRARFPGRWQ
jgi:hypothetical protein